MYPEDDFPPDGDQLPGAPLKGLIWDLSGMSSAFQLVLALQREGFNACLQSNHEQPPRETE